MTTDLTEGPDGRSSGETDANLDRLSLWSLWIPSIPIPTGSVDPRVQSVQYGAMHQANVSYTRNHLSEILARVREGETVLIMDRHQPVARLSPIEGTPLPDTPWQGDLVRRGLIRLATQRLKPEPFSDLPWPTPHAGGDILATLLADREEGR